MKTFFKTLWTAMLLFIGVSASAAITSGYYRIKSSYYDGRYITENTGDHTLITSSLSSSNYAQVWYLTVSNNNQVTIKNALTDRYISTVSNYSEVYPTKTTSNIPTPKPMAPILLPKTMAMVYIVPPHSRTTLYVGIPTPKPRCGRLNPHLSIKRN